MCFQNNDFSRIYINKNINKSANKKFACVEFVDSSLLFVSTPLTVLQILNVSRLLALFFFSRQIHFDFQLAPLDGFLFISQKLLLS